MTTLGAAIGVGLGLGVRLRGGSSAATTALLLLCHGVNEGVVNVAFGLHIVPVL